HEISLMVMDDLGILPPLYGGEHLGDDREVIPLWGFIEDEPELGALLLRVMPEVEPNPELQDARDEIGLTNDWPLSELLDMIKTTDGKSNIEGEEDIRNLSILFMVIGTHVQPAPGYDRREMLEFMADMRPYAAFPIIPTAHEGDEFKYLWEDLED